MKILLATDGSKCSVKAVKEMCSFVGNREDLTIQIISVVEPLAPMAPDMFGVGVEYYLDAEKTATQSASDAIKDAEDTILALLKDSTPAIESKVIKGKFPKNAIVDEATSWEADLVVLGSHGYGFLDRVLLGSVSSAVVHHVTCSVLIVR